MIQALTNLYYRYNPPEMVSWWQTKETVRAKVTEAEDGSYIMWMEGEKYPFPGYPRGHLLFGSLSKLKHNIKVKMLNDSWWKLEAGESHSKVVQDIQGPVMDEILTLGEASKYDMLPIEKNVPCVREFHRAWMASTDNERTKQFGTFLSYIFNEDDGYRMRFQWVVPYFKKLGFEEAMDMLEHAEVVDDMKERVRLIKRIVGIIIEEDPTFWTNFMLELDVKKVKLTKADKYYFRAKYFKVDYPYFQY